MSTKKVIAIVLFVLQGLGLVGALMSGSMYMQFSILSWFGFFLFGIVGGILIYLDGKDKKTKPTHTENQNSNTPTPVIITNKLGHSVVLNVARARSLILGTLNKKEVYFCTDSCLNELLESSSYHRTGNINYDLLNAFIANKYEELTTSQQNIINTIYNVSLGLSKKLTPEELDNVFYAFCKVAVEPEASVILQNSFATEKYLKSIMETNF